MFGLSIFIASVLIKSNDVAMIMKAVKYENLDQQIEDVAVANLDDESTAPFKNKMYDYLTVLLNLDFCKHSQPQK